MTATFIAPFTFDHSENENMSSVQSPKVYGVATMRHNPAQQKASGKPTFLYGKAQRATSRLRWLAALWSGFAGLVFGGEAVGQTLAPIVRSAVSDPTVGDNFGARTLNNFYDASKVVPAGAQQLSTSSQISDQGLDLGLGSEGKVISITEGEDRIIETRDAIPGGIPTATQYGGYGYGGSSSSMASGVHYGNSGGAYSGYGQTGSPVSNPCCPENCHDYYVSYESVFLKAKASENFSLSQGRFLGRYDYDFGSRITIGQMLDCVDGVEMVYTGPFEWNRSRTDQATTNSLQSVLTAGGGYTATDINVFNNSLRHIQAERIELQSYEANRRWFAWDIMSTLIGIRAFQYKETFLFDTAVASPDAFGFFRTRLENFMIGPQIGMDVARPVGQRLSIGSTVRLGVFANFNKGSTILVNRDNPLLNSSRRDVDIAGAIISGGTARYRITPRISVVGGYESWILAGVATVSEQNYVPITPATGVRYRAKDLVFFHGATGGVEIKY